MLSWPNGVGLRILDIVDSTNEEAKRVVDNINFPTWIMARVQTAGKGRRGRVWISELGNLSASLILKVKNAQQASLHGYVASLAVRDACIEFTGQADRYSLKWPNDLLINESKLAGILLECFTVKKQTYLIIGVGVNLATAPKLLQKDGGSFNPVSLVGATGVLVQPEKFLIQLAHSWQEREKEFHEIGFSSTRNSWLKCAYGIGQTILVRTGSELNRGEFINIDQIGRVLLNINGTIETISAGEMLEDEEYDDAPDD